MRAIVDVVRIERRIVVKVEGGSDTSTVEEVLRQTGLEFNPDTHQIVNPDEGQFELDGLVMMDERILVIPKEPDQDEGDGAV